MGSRIINTNTKNNTLNKKKIPKAFTDYVNIMPNYKLIHGISTLLYY